ncbi:MAG: tRNA 5-methylaminomethyl-2-thiouridine biosynthesis bifunctional protein MnmC [Chroococcidiopsis sp. SAG 2025]|uniref:tRNA (5-methylaminomethyl-2-thiouridine)(34)-methyltransferase MnmD n=1 Tax=Chroococcidiopsis sp. SAG 2025 TaxID=171389 RepID=UPI002936DF58|nr:MnmC family methyltransferase [Chroococcidiopsis sp. SAG 2025]MDV2990699.1 tRNA 5-methylaminomethyl-2-thiouridine biosynthesis bifunctional protein MnmC [Chroococcidiopsis sp. SAG 2025]
MRRQETGDRRQEAEEGQGGLSPSIPDSRLPTPYSPQLTADGSYTFFSTEFGEAYHSQFGARQEAEFKFVEPTQLRQKALQQKSLRLLDVCYGLGYNTAAALAAIWEVNPNCRVEVVGLELDPTVPQAAIAHNLLNDWSQLVPPLTQLATTHQVTTDCLQAKLLLGDARQSIQTLQASGFQADAVFLDPFSPPTCPQLWTVEFLGYVARCMHINGILATYSCAASVRSALQAAGLKIGSTSPVGRRSPGTVASWHDSDLPPLSQEEREHLQTRAATPYRDPQLSDSADIICQRRVQEQQTSSLEPTSRWRKRRSQDAN